MFVLAVVVFLALWGRGDAADKNKPHGHRGVLEPYDGHHIPYTISQEQNAKLDAGEYATILTRAGKSGRGVIIQDVHAPPNVCMDRIRDLANYHKMVPNLKSIEISNEVKHPNGTVTTRAKFNVGISLVGFGYYLILTFEPRYNTYTWTLDYDYNSDFDDNTGHWQVVPHPAKEGWSRVLYSTEVKLFPWIPEFVGASLTNSFLFFQTELILTPPLLSHAPTPPITVTFLTKTALISSTTWVKRESEKIAASGKNLGTPIVLPDLRSCFSANDTHASYETRCSEQSLTSKKAPASTEDASDAGSAAAGGRAGEL
jgi:Polyketide cyclase / dehydrase and lipid transport